MKATAEKVLRAWTLMGFVLAIMIFVVSSGIYGQSTHFTYQGSLDSGGSPANGNHDFDFLLFNAASGGAQVGTTVSLTNVAVANGVFSVSLDFGSQFPGANRFLEIRVRPTGQGGMTILAPRQLLASAPYAVKSLSAGNADQLAGVAANQYVLTTDPRMADARNPLPGSNNYIRNDTTVQSAHMNISGNGDFGGTITGLFVVGNIVNATQGYELNGSRVLAEEGTNIFVGTSAGIANNGGVSNAFFGPSTGVSNSIGDFNSFFGISNGVSNNSGSENSFFGYRSGRDNTTGSVNTFVGTKTGQTNTTGEANSFFGGESGFSNTSGGFNSFFGRSAGRANTVGAVNVFVGSQAGDVNTTGGANTFVGSDAGGGSTTGASNTFLGRDAGKTNVTGSNNSALGRGADVGSANLSFATAIGSEAKVFGNNEIRLGRNDGSDTVRAAGDLFVGGFVGVGNFGTSGGTDVCHNGGTLSVCSSSLRYKSKVETYTGGLEVVRRLRPITFTWNQNGTRDVGFGAEEIESIEPLLTTYNENGEIEGVKYKQITTVLVNAVNEQQNQLEKQIEEINVLKARVEALKKLVCEFKPEAKVCK